MDLISVSYFEIKNNRIYNTANYESIDIKEGSSYGSIHHNLIIPIQSAGIYIDSQGKNATNIDIYNNWIHDGVRDFTRGIALATENGGSLKNVTVYNNVVNNNPAIGIAIASYSDGPIDNVTISSNTVYNNGLKVNWGGGIVIEYAKATNVKIVNNIAYQNKARGDLVTDNGLNSAFFTNLVGINPIFVNASNQDFHLQSSSPAIDKGSSPNFTLFVPAYDFDGNSRPKGAGYDIGAYEFVSTPVPFDFSLSLNPSNGLVMQGDSISTTATATLVSGTSHLVSFSCSGLPAGASCSFSPPSVNPTASSTLIISTSFVTPAGVYPITVSGTDGDITRTTTYNLEVVPFSTQFDFSLSLNPSNDSVVQGDSISTIATATLISGTSQPVSLSCSGLPSGTSCSFNPSSLYPPNSSTLTISASTSTPAGAYSITINGVSGNITRTANYALKVNTANLSIGEAVDNTALQWTTGSNAAWFGQSNVYYYGNDAAQSGKIGDNQNTWVQTTVTGPGTLQFYWKVSSEPNSNILNFFIDNAKRARISGNTQWTQKTYTIPSGTHTLKWMYTKDKAATSGSDAGWLDKVVYTPST